MASLYDVNNQLITDIVTDLIPKPDTLQIEHRTLDGQYHIQTIGTAAKIVNIICITDIAGKVKIDLAAATGMPLKVIEFDKYYIGLIRNVPDCEHFKPLRYRISFTLLVQSEGVA